MQDTYVLLSSKNGNILSYPREIIASPDIYPKKSHQYVTKTYKTPFSLKIERKHGRTDEKST